MADEKKEIGGRLDDIRDLLGIESSKGGPANPVLAAWFVGACGNNEAGEWHDFSDEYIAAGIWKDRSNGKDKDRVNSIKVGDRIAIKAAYNKKKGLPFNNNGKTVGVMLIKATGVVTENPMDGQNIKVNWVKENPEREWFGYGVMMSTIHFVEASSGVTQKALLDFTFCKVAQDYTACEAKYANQDNADSGFDEDNGDTDLDDTERVDGGENTILYGVPGAGKSYAIQHEYCDDDDRIERVVFHPDYTYSDFAGQILPSVDENGTVSYGFAPGPFTILLKKAYQDPSQLYFLIIEEVNRGNAPAIFGDIFQLLDREPDGTSSYGITNADIALAVYKDPEHKVKIPSNMSILCTMNTSDQNVFTLDTAFQRRWNMRLIENSFHKDVPSEKKFAETNILDSHVSWEAFCDKMNQYILEKNLNMTSSEDKRLGTHFITENDLEYDSNADSPTADDKTRIKANLHNRKFPEKVIKYLWDDAFKFNKSEIFDMGKFPSLESVIKEFSSEKSDDRFDIFVENIKADLEAMATKTDGKDDDK